MAIREGKWKCTYCGHVNMGRDLACAGCGAVRDKDVVFFLEEDAPEVTDAAQLADALDAPDWICAACGTSNRARTPVCRQCGSPRGDSAARAPEGPAEPPAPRAVSAAAPKRVGLAVGVGAAAIGAVVLAVLAILGYFAFRQHDVDLVVDSVHWTRSVDVERLRTLTKEDWEGEVPNDARVLARHRELHHTDKVQTGTERVRAGTRQVQTGTRRVKVGTRDRGNGYFEDVYEDQPVYRDEPNYEDRPIYRDVPVYRDKVKYTVDRWVKDRTETREGDDTSPVWPEVPTDAGARPGERSETYVVRLRDPKSGKTYEQKPSAEEFARFAPGASCRGRVNGLGSLAGVDPP